MYNVSEAYATESRAVIRNQSYIKVELGVVEPDAADTSTVTDNGELYYAETPGLVEGEAVTSPEYGTLECNRFVLDGSLHELSPASGFTYQGYVSSAISDDNGAFTTPPVLIITFSDYYSFIGLTLNFSDIYTDYPSDITIIAYKDDAEQYRKNFYPNTASYFTDDPIPSTEGVYVNKLVIQFNKTSIPNRRVRLESILFGQMFYFDNENIEGANWNRAVSLVSTELPTEEVTVSLIDSDKNFSPEEPQGVYAYLEARQPVKVKLGYELDDGTVEWIQCADMYTTSEFSVDSGSTIPILDLEAQSTLLTLTETWDYGVYSSAGRTLYELAKEMLDNAVLIHPEYVLDDVLKNYTTKYPLPRDDIRNNLQLIANAGMCLLYTDREGVIHIAPEPTASTGFAMTYNDVMSAPTTTKYPVLYSVTTSYNDLVVASEATELTNTEVSYDTQTEVEFTYNMSTEQSISVSSGLTMSGTPTFYAEYCKVLLSGSGTVTINGKEITVNNNIVRKYYNTNGEDCPVDNELIGSQAHAEVYADWIAAFEQRRNEYEVDDRGYPELDMGDKITLETAFTEAAEVTVVEHNISFNGAISGDSKYVIDSKEE